MPKTYRNIGACLVFALLFLGCAKADAPKLVHVTRMEYGTEWPFSVDEGTLVCLGNNVYFVVGPQEHSGRWYPMNAAAIEKEISDRTQGGRVIIGDERQARTPVINEILTKPNVPTTLLQVGESLCERTPLGMSPERASRVSTDWHLVKTWDGSGIKETESFEIQSREWRLSWSVRNATSFKEAGIFHIYVYNDKGELVSLVSHAHGAGKETSYVRGTGRFYLKITSANIDWSVAVEDQR